MVGTLRGDRTQFATPTVHGQNSSFKELERLPSENNENAVQRDCLHLCCGSSIRDGCLHKSGESRDALDAFRTCNAFDW